MMTVLPTRNEDYGFYGTVAVEGHYAPYLWDVAFVAVQEATEAYDENAYGPEGVRDFLDSRLGRHFADQVNERLQFGKTVEEAVTSAVDRFMRFPLTRRDREETGAPPKTPYLTGWVTAFAFEAETEKSYD